MANDKVEKTGLPLKGLQAGSVWQNLQNAVTELIGCNMTLLDPQGKKILEPSRHTPFCYDPHEGKGPQAADKGPNCIFQCFEACMLENAALHVCRHKVDFATLKFRIRNRVVAVAILGPFLMGKRKFLDAEAVSQGASVKDPIVCEAWARDLTVLSVEKLTKIQNFLQCLFDTFIILSGEHLSAVDAPNQ